MGAVSLLTLHLLAKERANRIHAEQALSSRLAAPSQANALDVAAVVEFVKQTPPNGEASLNAACVEKFRVLSRGANRCRANRVSCFGLLTAVAFAQCFH